MSILRFAAVFFLVCSINQFAFGQDSSGGSQGTQIEQSATNTELSPEESERQKQAAEDERERQKQAAEDAAEAGAAGCAVCGGSLVTMIVAAVAFLALNIALLIWVSRDAKSRGMDSSVLWMFLVMFTGLIGFVIYIFSRPQGELMQCTSCKGKRLSASAKCPHCQNS